MLSSRMVNSLRRQDWFAVVLELVIVVVGILLALQLDNWNEQRKARHEGDQWRAQMLAELEKNRLDLEGRLEYYGQALAFGEFALDRLESPGTPAVDEAWDIVLGAFQAGQIWPYTLNGPTFRQVQSAGDLGLVGDADTISALAYFYDVTAYDFELISGGLPKYREMIRERMPWPIQNFIWRSDCQETILKPGLAESGQAFRLTRCAPPADTSDLPDVVDSLRRDRDLKNALRGRLSQLKVSVDGIGRQIERPQSVIERVQQQGR